MSSARDMTNITQNVLDQLIAMLTRGAIKAGERLPANSDLVAMLRISETELQNSLSIFEVLGMIEFKDDAYFLVRELNPATLNSLLFGLLLERGTRREMYELRLVFELGALELAIAKATPEDLQDLADHLRKYEARMIEGDLESLPRLDELFHLKILEMSKNPSFIKIGKTVAKIYSLPLEKALRSMGASQILQNHRALYEAIAAKDFEQARDLQKKSFLKTMEYF